jgi:hypothetical protein
VEITPNKEGKYKLYIFIWWDSWAAGGLNPESFPIRGDPRMVKGQK